MVCIIVSVLLVTIIHTLATGGKNHQKSMGCRKSSCAAFWQLKIGIDGDVSIPVAFHLKGSCTMVIHGEGVQPTTRITGVYLMESAKSHY